MLNFAETITKKIKRMVEKNFRTYVDRLNQIGVRTDLLIEKFGEKIKYASYASSNEFGLAYQGSFLECVMKKITLYAVQEAKLLQEEGIDIDLNSVIKVSFLNTIAKSVFFIPNDNQYEINKGKIFKFDENEAVFGLKTSIVSLWMCTNECGITFTKEELDAMTILDRQDEYASKGYCSPLSWVIKRANEKFSKINNIKSNKK